MKYPRSVVLCVLLLVLSIGAVTASVPAGFSFTVVPEQTDFYLTHGDCVLFNFLVTNNSTEPISIVDLGGTMVPLAGSPAIDLPPMGAFDGTSPGNTGYLNNGSMEITPDIAPGTVYSYKADHYIALFRSDYSQLWNTKTGAWEDNTAGYLIRDMCPGYDQMADYSISAGSAQFNVTVTPEPSSLLGLISGGIGLVGLRIRRKLA